MSKDNFPVHIKNLLLLRTHIINQRKKKPEFDYNKFDTLVRENFNDVLEHLNCRWLISIVDTYLIQQEDLELSSRALFITSFFNSIRLWSTDLLGRSESKRNNFSRNSNPLFGGFYTFVFGYGDTLQNLLYRARIVLNNHEKSKEILLPIFEKILKECVDNEKSPLRKMCLDKNKKLMPGIDPESDFSPRE